MHFSDRRKETPDFSGVSPLGTVPYWLLLIAAAIVPIARLHRLRAAREAVARGLCPCCGYDLRATPDRCLECGTAVKRAAAR